MCVSVCACMWAPLRRSFCVCQCVCVYVGPIEEELVCVNRGFHIW